MTNPTRRVDGLTTPIPAGRSTSVRYLESVHRGTAIVLRQRAFGFQTSGRSRTSARRSAEAPVAAVADLDGLLALARTRVEQMPWSEDTAEEIEERAAVTQALLQQQLATEPWQDQE